MAGRVNLTIRLVTTFFLLFFSGIAAAVERNVPSPYPTIQDAINAAVNGDVVIVAPGTYTGTGNRDLDFRGKAVTVRSTDTNDPNVIFATIIDCQGTEADPHRGFYFHNGEDANSVLNGLTIINGYAESGGGIYCENGSPTIINCIIKGNTAVTGGGITGNGCTITGCAIYRNFSRTKGGGLYCTNCSISHCLIIKNSVLEGVGGGISASDCTISNCIISNNAVAGHNAVQQGTSIPNGGNAYGGGLSLTCSLGSEVTVQNCIIYGNKTSGGNGCIVDDETEPPPWNPSSDGGNAYGGGIYCGSEGSFTIENCTFSDNHVVGGPPGKCFVHLYEGGHYVICGDPGDSFGGGICSVSDNALIHQCIFADDTANYGAEVATVKKTVSGNPSHAAVSYCDIQTGQAATYVGADCILDWGAGNIDAEPNLTPDGHLCADSPCINAGAPAHSTPPGQTDIDDEQRIYDGIVDIGGDEFIDTDSDGLPNFWEQKYFGDPIGGDPCDDPDEDGYNSLVEYRMDTDPLINPSKKYVDSDSGDDTWDGSSPLWKWDGTHGPKATIQAAIDAAADGDTIIVAPGTYTGNGNRDIDFLGKAITVRSESGPENCIINCNGMGRGFYFHQDEDANSVLDGFTITNGLGSSDGGGIYCENGSPTITNCTFSDNSASGDGGGMYNDNSNPTLTNCTFSSNSAVTGVGGGMANYANSNPTLNNCIFIANLAEAGGGIYCDSSNPTVTNCTFIGNSASDIGGGMFNDSSSPTLTNCTFTGNNASHHGGGMYNYSSSSPTITNCTFSNNSANISGGGILNLYDSGPMVTNCTFSGNLANSGGGMYNESSSPTLTNCTLRGNNASRYGGGMDNEFSSSPTITNCTFTGNSVSQGGSYGGGGMYNYSFSKPTLANCILWGNTATNGAQIYNRSSSTPTVSFSDVQGGWAGTGNINADPCFVDAAAGNLHLLPDSPCINTGNPAFAPGPNETDIDGEPRVMLARVDMGADEFNPFEIDFTVVNKRRIGRTLFEYDCAVTLTNISNYSVSNVALEIIKASENMSLIDPIVTFGDIEIGPDESATSSDMCTFRIDRSKSTDPAEIIWKSTCEIVDGAPAVLDIASGISFLNFGILPGDISGDDEVNFEDLKILTDQWLQPPGSPSADIAPLPTSDNFVDFLDFALLAQNWLRASGD